MFTGMRPQEARALRWHDLDLDLEAHTARVVRAVTRDGLAPSGVPGVGLIEPNPPTPGALPDLGDNLDAVDLDTVSTDLTGAIYFSLDSPFVDPLEVPPVNNGTAIANGFSSADVLVSVAGGAPAVAIRAAVLGLDLTGFNLDDLDALIFDDADGSGSLTAADSIYFAVRRGSAVIGVLDSTFGVPIEEGDVLGSPAGAGYRRRSSSRPRPWDWARPAAAPPGPLAPTT